MKHSTSFYFKDIKLVIFDLDGTLVHTAPDIIESVKFILKHFNCEEMTDKEIASCIGGGARNVLKKAMGSQAEEHLEEALVLFKSYYAENCAIHSSLYPHANDLLDILNNNGKMIALCTLKAREATLRILREFNINHYFQMVVTVDDIQKPKPDPQGIQVILDNLNVQKEDTMIIGDTESDILAGKNANVKTIGVTFGYGSEQSIRGCNPDVIVSDLGQLVE